MAFNCQITKYLKHYAEPDIASLVGFPQDRQYENVVVIPAYNETSEFLHQFSKGTSFLRSTLAIVVINQPEDVTDKLRQTTLFNYCLGLGECAWHNKEFYLVNVKDSPCDILVIDKFTHGLPRKKGVGLARKVGTDCACQLIMQGNITANWIHSTDADATLPKDYFEATNSLPQEVVAGCYEFHHQSDDESIHQANAQYELSLRYYVAGLKYANSSYSFFTIGSVLTFKAHAYAKVRGFPKRSAGEDFYLLNKLAKLGRIATFNNVVIKLQARTSNRVPFGTGPAVLKILASKALGQEYHYYHPGVFDELKNTLEHVKSLYQQQEHLSRWFDGLSMSSRDGLLSLGIEKFVDAHKTCSQEQFERQFIVWFDAFRTLKFIHFIRDNVYEDIPLNDAISQAPFRKECR